MGRIRTRGVDGPKAGSEKGTAKADYLAKYYSADGTDQHGTGIKKKKRRRRHNETQPSHIRVVDEDVGWPAQTSSPPSGEVGEGDNSDDGPVVENAAEVHHQLQLLQGQAKFSSQWESEEVPEHTQIQHHSDDDNPPRLRHRHDSDDESPERRPTPGQGADRVRQTKQRHYSSDDSPPRRTYPTASMHAAAVAKEVQDAPPHHRRDLEDDRPPRLSRARQRAARHDTDDESPPRRLDPDSRLAVCAETPSRAGQVAKHEPDIDRLVRRFPVGRANGGHSQHSESPSQNGAADMSPPRRQGPPRSGRTRPPPRASTDCRKLHKDAGLTNITHVQTDHTDGTSDRQHQGHDTLEHGKAMTESHLGQGLAVTGGLVESHVMAQQIRMKKKDDRQRILDMDPLQSGRGAVSTFRLDGKIVSKEQFEEAMAAKQPKRHPKYLEEDVEWKSGLAQRRTAEAQQAALERESKKKFQREFDEDADARMQEELRMDDPMAEYFSSKYQKVFNGGDLVDAHATELSHASGFKIPQAVPAHSWIKRGVQPLPNRYSIKPGRHWDGVSRGNGFESKFVFQYRHNRAERERDRYVLAEDL